MDVWVPHGYRGHGYGRALLERVLEDADYHGITLTLTAYASGGLSQQDLEAWYERLGFVWECELERGTFIRKPQTNG